LRELYAYYARTEGMLASLIRDAPLVPVVERMFGAYTSTCAPSARG
jgi:hypothetical protein